jgi:hypothetical protein
MESVSKFVIGRLQGRGLGAESHPGANLLTAFAEQSLDRHERGGVMEHLALCGDCREILALAMGDDELQPILVLHSQRKRATEWFGWPTLRWGVLGITLVTASVAGVRYTHSHSNLNSASNTQRDTAVETSPAKDLSSSLAQVPATEDKSQNGVIKPQFEQKLPQQRAQARESSSNDASSLVAMNRNPVNRNFMTGPAAGGFDIVKAKDPVPTQTPSGGQVPSPNFPLQTSPQMMLRASPKWAVTTTGSLQRSFDGGKNWENISPAADAADMVGQGNRPIFYAVAGIGSEVWVGGATGMLYHSGDSGNHWSRVAPSAGGIGLTGDIIKIDFSDSQHGKISTSNAEFWTTSDSAQTWQKQR